MANPQAAISQPEREMRDHRGSVRPLSLSPLTTIELSPPELVDCAASAGFTRVGIRVCPGGTDTAWPMLGGGTPMMRETLRRLAETGLEVLDVEVLRVHPDKDPVEALQILDAAAELGARFALVNCNDPDPGRLRDRLHELAEEAAQRGLQLGVEFMIFSELKTFADAVTLVRSLDHPAVSIVVDSLHLARSGGTPAEVSQYADLVRYLQLCDGPAQPTWPDDETAMAESRTARLLPGAGELPLSQTLSALSSDIALSVEAPVAEVRPSPAKARAAEAYQATRRVVSRLR